MPSGGPAPDVSLVLVAHDMARELPRTLASLSRRMQRGVDDIAYEIIVVDNGSRPPVPLMGEGMVTVLHVEVPTPSPAPAINLGLSIARGDLVGVLIDGARMASPGLIHQAVVARSLHPRPVITTLGFHLGPDVQMRTVTDGYDQATEDRLLASSGWEEDGYRLFSIAAFAGSNREGWLGPIAESTALFLPRSVWHELEGYHERFVSPGGGLVNLDTYRRACQLPDSQVVVLLGEGTFHQVHGGVATNARVSPYGPFHQEYQAIRGHSFEVPETNRIYLGACHGNHHLSAGDRRADDRMPVASSL